MSEEERSDAPEEEIDDGSVETPSPKGKEPILTPDEIKEGQAGIVEKYMEIFAEVFQNKAYWSDEEETAMNTKFAEIINEIPNIKGLNDADFEQIDAMMARAMTAFKTSKSRKDVENELQRLREQIKQIQASKNPAGAPSPSSSPEEFKTPAPSKEAGILTPVPVKTFDEMFAEIRASPQKTGDSPSIFTSPFAQQDVALTGIDEQTKEILSLSDKTETVGDAVKKIDETMRSLNSRMKAGEITALNKLHGYNKETIARMDRVFKDTTKNDAEKFTAFKSSLLNNSFNGRSFGNAYAMKYAVMGFISELLRRNMPREAPTPLRFQTTP